MAIQKVGWRSYVSAQSTVSMVSSGMLLHLDAGNTTSYSGSGTTWTDLSGQNNNATLYNSPSYSSTLQGSLTFNGTSNYASVSDTPFRFGNQFTINLWFYWDGLDKTNNNLISKRAGDPVYNQYGIGIHNGDPYGGGTGKTLTFFCRQEGSVASNTDTLLKYVLPSTPGYYNVTGTMDVNSQKLYVNGALVDSSSINQTGFTYNIPGRSLLIGNTWNNAGNGLLTGYNKNIYAAAVYNRPLTQAEVIQNFESKKTRFGFNVTDTDAKAFLYVSSVGNPLIYPAIETLVTDLKTSGIWTKMKAIYPFVGGNATSHKFNLKDPRDLDEAYRLVFNGGWTHTNNGIKGNGTNGYADTKLIPSSNYPNSYDISFGFYSRTDIIENSNDISAYVSSTQCIGIDTRWSDGKIYGYIYRDASPYNIVVPNSSSAGLISLSRTSTTMMKIYRDTSILGTSTSTMSGTIPNVPIRLSSGSVGSYSSREKSFTYIGNGLTDTETFNLYNIVQKFQTTLGRQVGVPIVADTDAQAFLNAAVITDTTQANAVNTLVTSLKSAGIWTKMKAIYPFVGGSATSHKFNLKDPRDLDAAYRLTFSGGWTHTSTGAKPNGTNAYADTKLKPTDMAQNSAHMSTYLRTQYDNGYDMGCSTNLYFLLSANLGSSIAPQGILNVNISSFTYPNLGTQAFFLTSRTNSTTNKTFRNTSLVTNNTSASIAPEAYNIYLGAGNRNNAGWQYSYREQAFSSIGDGLTDVEATAFYTAVQAFQTSLGRQV